MTFRDDDRGASVQVGAIILFGFLVLAIAGWQAQVVPQDNAEVEYTHSQRVTDDMQDVRNEIVSAPGRTSLRSVPVELGPSYPPRTLFVNPGTPAGTLRTVGTTNESLNLTVTNAEATATNVDDFWDGSARAYNTGAIAYEPGYNVYTGAPDTVYENTVLYDDHDDTTVTVAGQDLIEGRTLSLVTLNGSLQRTSAGVYSVDLTALSSSTRTVAVTDSGGNITVSFASRRDVAWWNETLHDADEFVGEDGYVVDVRQGTPVGGQFTNVTIELAGDTTYRLQMAKVGVGSGTEETEKAYVVDVEGNNTEVQTGNTRKLVVEVRDRHNNPVSGVTVEKNDTGTDLNGGSLSGTGENNVTDADGRVTFEFTGGSTGEATIRFNVSDDNTPLARELVTFSVDVTGGGGGDSTGPQTTNVQTSPNGPYSPGDTFTLSADVSDIERGGTQIIAAEWYNNTSGDPGEGNANQMSASDGTFDTVEEAVEDTVDTTGWPAGDYELYVRGKDANGNWGPTGQTQITVESGAGNPPSIDFFDVTDNSCNSPPGCPGGDQAEFDISWDISDPDGDLQAFTVWVNKSGTNQDTYTETNYGFNDTETYTESNAYGDTYTIKIVAEDSNGNTDCMTTGSFTANGTDPSTSSC